MMLRFVIVSAVLSAASVHCRWPCQCDESLVSCSVYDFAREMINTMNSIVPNGNMVISPLSLWIVLSYVVWYTEGPSKNDLIIRLHDREYRICGSGAYIIKRYFKSAAGHTNPTTGDPFHLHTTVYFSGSSSTINSTTASINTFDDSLHTVRYFKDFTENGLDMIRNIHKEEFKSMSKFMYPGDITKNTEYVILNMLNFNTQWKIPFGRMKEFRHKNRRYTMMYASGAFTNSYDRSRDTSYLYLETQNSGMIMVIVLTDSKRARPNPQWDFFDPKNGRTKHQRIAMPKFKFEVEYNLRQVVMGFNLGAVFEPGFQVHKAVSKVSQAVQRTIVSIDERGVTFEAYTALVGDPTLNARNLMYQNVPFMKPFEFYLFGHKNLVAYGRIMDPTY